MQIIVTIVLYALTHKNSHKQATLDDSSTLFKVGAIIAQLNLSWMNLLLSRNVFYHKSILVTSTIQAVHWV